MLRTSTAVGGLCHAESLSTPLSRQAIFSRIRCPQLTPKFEAAIGRCIAIWSYVDDGILLGTESDAAHRVFLILRRWTNQRQALDAAAEGILPGDELTAYRALMVEYGSLESQRNNLAHGCFGICPDDEDLLFMIEDLLFMIKVENHVEWMADVLPKLDSGAVIPDRTKVAVGISPRRL